MPIKKSIIITTLLCATSMNANAYDWQHEQIMREGREAYESQQRWAENYRRQEQMEKLQKQMEYQTELLERQTRQAQQSSNIGFCRVIGYEVVCN